MQKRLFLSVCWVGIIAALLSEVNAGPEVIAVAAVNTVVATQDSCEAMGLSDEQITDEQLLESCDVIVVGPDVSVAAPDGNLRLRTGSGISLEPGVAVESGGRLSTELVCLSGECSSPNVCIPALAVGNGSPGNTCDLPSAPPPPVPELPDLPRLALDEYTYNELFTGSGYGGVFGANGGGFQNPEPSDNWPRSKGCGACLEVTGPNGSLVGMVWEIADIAAVGDNGRPVSVHIESDHITEVRDSLLPGVDITIRPVPCPVTSDIQVKVVSFFDSDWAAKYFTVFNHTDPVEQVEIRAASGHDQWYSLRSDWTNRWRMNEITPFYVPVPDPPDATVQLRITSIYGGVVVTEPFELPDGAAGTSSPSYFDGGTQFAERQVSAGACTVNWSCGNWVLDAHETCETSQKSSIDCSTLGVGTGTAWCNPGTCEWDTRTCSEPQYCTLTYRLDDSRFFIRDTTFGEYDSNIIGNGLSTGPLNGFVVIRTAADGGSPTDGVAEILQFELEQSFTVTSSVYGTDIITNVIDSAGDGTSAMATGTLTTGTTNQLTFEPCTLPVGTDVSNGDYTQAESYTPDDNGSGAGCLAPYRSIGNVNCDAASFICNQYNLSPGDNARDETWEQPLNEISLSGDYLSLTMSQIGMYSRTIDGSGAMAVPNWTPSTTWMHWAGSLESMVCD